MSTSSEQDFLILQQLRSPHPHPLSLPELTEATGLSPETIQQTLLSLEESGFQFAQHPHQGISILKSPVQLIADDLRARLPDHLIIGKRILTFQKTESTNTLALKLGKHDAPHGTCVFADAQTSGRGRLARKWHSPAGTNLYFSILLRPSLPSSQWATFAFSSALAICQALQNCFSLPSYLKWPNDIIIRNKKSGGILLESSLSTTSPFLVVGIGINVNQTEFPDELKDIATSLQIELQSPVSRPELATELLIQLDRFFLETEQEPESIIRKAEAKNLHLNQFTQVKTPEGIVSGIMRGLDTDGALLILTSHSSTPQRITSGDVSLLTNFH